LIPRFLPYQQRLVEELKASGIFAKVVLQPTGPDDIIMNTEVDAFVLRAIRRHLFASAGYEQFACGIEVQWENPWMKN